MFDMKGFNSQSGMKWAVFFLIWPRLLRAWHKYKYSFAVKCIKLHEGNDTLHAENTYTWSRQLHISFMVHTNAIIIISHFSKCKYRLFNSKHGWWNLICYPREIGNQLCVLLESYVVLRKLPYAFNKQRLINVCSLVTPYGVIDLRHQWPSSPMIMVPRWLFNDNLLSIKPSWTS